MSEEIPEVDVQIEVETDVSLDEELRYSSEIMRQTLRDEGGEAGHGCALCGKVYKSSTTLNCHLQLKHPAGDAGAAVCTLCDKSYSSLASLDKHMHYKHLNKHRCTTCYRPFETDIDFEEHNQSCRKAAVECPHCSKVYVSQVSLRNHVKYKHPPSSDNWCDVCRRSFSSARGLANHLGKLHAPQATVCRLCEREFLSVTALRSHNLYRHTREPARCQLCCKLFVDTKSLERHAAKKHAAVRAQAENAQPCSACARTFVSVADLDKHFIDEHNMTDLQK